METTKTYIEVTGVDTGRPSERPPKTNWRIEMIKKGLGLLQHASPRKSAEVVWHYFTMPGRSKSSIKQKALLRQAKTLVYHYKGDKIIGYRWGQNGPKVLVCHGWRSKTADFRAMIESLLNQGYVVEAVDLRAHGRSEGKHTALPEYRDILQNFYMHNGPYEAVIGYSLGGIASGLVLSELSKEIQPKKHFVIASPPYVSYFFKEIIDDVGLNDKVFQSMCDLVEKNYQENVEYFDLRDKYDKLSEIDTHLIYCEDDKVVPFSKGEELEKAWPNAKFVQAKGLGHYKIINNEKIIEYIQKQLNTA